MTVMAFQGKHAETLERKHHQRVMKRLAMPLAPMPLRIPAMAVLPFLVLSGAVASVTAPGSCGVSKPLFKARHGETWRDMASAALIDFSDARTAASKWSPSTPTTGCR